MLFYIHCSQNPRSSRHAQTALYFLGRNDFINRFVGISLVRLPVLLMRINDIQISSFFFALSFPIEAALAAAKTKMIGP